VTVDDDNATIDDDDGMKYNGDATVDSG